MRKNAICTLILIFGIKYAIIAFNGLVLAFLKLFTNPVTLLHKKIAMLYLYVLECVIFEPLLNALTLINQLQKVLYQSLI